MNAVLLNIERYTSEFPSVKVGKLNQQRFRTTPDRAPKKNKSLTFALDTAPPPYGRPVILVTGAWLRFCRRASVPETVAEVLEHTNSRSIPHVVSEQVAGLRRTGIQHLLHGPQADWYPRSTYTFATTSKLNDDYDLLCGAQQLTLLCWSQANWYPTLRSIALITGSQTYWNTSDVVVASGLVLIQNTFGKPIETCERRYSTSRMSIQKARNAWQALMFTLGSLFRKIEKRSTDIHFYFRMSAHKGEQRRQTLTSTSGVLLRKFDKVYRH